MIFQHVIRHKRIIDVCDARFFWKIKEFVYKKITHSIFAGICDTWCFTCLSFRENSIRPDIKCIAKLKYKCRKFRFEIPERLFEGFLGFCLIRNHSYQDTDTIYCCTVLCSYRSTHLRGLIKFRKLISSIVTILG